MIVTGRRTWYIAAVILGREFTYRKLEWDDGLMDSLVEAEENFWNNYVKAGIIPPPDGSRAGDEVLGRYFRTAGKADTVKLVGFDEKLARREEILDAVARLQKEQKQIEQEVKLFMGSSQYAASGRYRVSWSDVDSVRLDTKRIRAEKPEIFAEYGKASHYRRFDVKAS